MTHDPRLSNLLPLGEKSQIEESAMPAGIGIDSFSGPVRVEWKHTAALTPRGQLSFFIDHLKSAGLLDALMADCPQAYTSPNAPAKRDVFGTAILACGSCLTACPVINGRCFCAAMQALAMKRS